MKKNQVNEILVNQTKRRNTVLGLALVIIIVFVITLSFFTIYFNRSKKQYVNYNESSEIDYKVFLKDNEFFEDEYLPKDKQYIASLIDYIKANFNYKLSLDEKMVEYKYSYRIEADVVVKEKGTNNPLYTTKKVLLNDKEIKTSLNEVIIDENIDIDYNYYNSLIKNFINIYGLDDTESILNINMYVNVIGACEEFENNKDHESVISLSIPLTTKTMAIEISNDLINSQNNVILCKSNYSYNFVFIIFGVIFAIVDIALIVYTVKYVIKTRTAENIYEKELKKILNNYSSYIQTLSCEFDFKDYQLLKVGTFTDMLEIRDTIKQPILMRENDRKTGAYFVIPSSTKILYVYRLKISDIKKEIKKENLKDLEDF